MIPIWKDKLVYLGSGDSNLFRVYSGQSIIYQGKAYKRPDADRILVRVNDICADLLHNNFPALSGDTPIELPLFSVGTLVDDEWEEIDDFTFAPDYSYEDGRDLNDMTAPIIRRLDKRQVVLLPHCGALLGRLKGRDGGIVHSWNYTSGCGTLAVDLADYPIATRLEWGAKSFDIVDTCNEWVLHYKNAFGGWDSLLIEGGLTWEDQLARKVFEVEYDNRQSTNRGKTNNRNDVSRRCTIRTGWLSDDESARMHHLLNSTDVYLQRIGTDEVLPLILTNASTPYKTFQNQGRKMVDYTIEAEVAHSYTRK